MPKAKFVVWFKEVDKEDIGTVGGKGANLGEMTRAGLPVPPGFIVTAQAYFHFLDAAGIRHEMEKILAPLDVNNSRALDEAAIKAVLSQVEAAAELGVSPRTWQGWESGTMPWPRHRRALAAGFARGNDGEEKVA